MSSLERSQTSVAVTDWQAALPTRLLVGPGSLAQLGEWLAGQGALPEHGWCLVRGPEKVFDDMAQALQDQLGSRPLAVFSAVTANPTVSQVRQLSTEWAPWWREGVMPVALGGGSAIDLTKGVLHACDVRTSGFLAIPTTAGTGSELTRWATVWDLEAGRKTSVEADWLQPQQALVDSKLCLSLPWSVTLASGLDALSHALESLWNRSATPVSVALALAAVPRVLEALPRLQRDGRDLAARVLQSEAAVLAGMAFSQTRTALAHALSYDITLRRGVPHGIACSFSLPMIFRALEGRGHPAVESLRGLVSPEGLAAWMEQLGVETRWDAYGLDGAALALAVEAALSHPRGQNFLDPEAARAAFC